MVGTISKYGLVGEMKRVLDQRLGGKPKEGNPRTETGSATHHQLCNAECQKKHLSTHNICKLRAAELRDVALFRDPPTKGGLSHLLPTNCSIFDMLYLASRLAMQMTIWHVKVWLQEDYL
jgi:hypothetical protein